MSWCGYFKATSTLFNSQHFPKLIFFPNQLLPKKPTIFSNSLHGVPSFSTLLALVSSKTTTRWHHHEKRDSSLKSKDAKQLECNAGTHLIVDGDWSMCDRNICVCDRGMPPNFCDTEKLCWLPNFVFWPKIMFLAENPFFHENWRKKNNAHLHCKHLSPQCQNCNRGYHVNNNKQCRRNKCKCNNGTPAFYCPQHKYEKCQYCASGFRLGESGLCKERKVRPGYWSGAI